MPNMTPLEWVAVLDERLEARQLKIRRLNDYYDGTQPLLFASEQFRKAFGGLFSEFSDNWCAPVINACAERLKVTGFRFGDTPQADGDAWRIWQANDLDAGANLGIKASLIDSRSALLIWPTSDPNTPKITVESAMQMVVAYDSGTGERLAAWKRWTDEWTGEKVGTLYLPDGLYKFRKAKQISTSIVLPRGAMKPPEWERRLVKDEAWPLPNPMGVVPVVELQNDPRLGCEPRSDLDSVIPLQDAVNKLFADMMVSAEFSAFRQKWATGIDIPVNPVTNQPLEDWEMAVSKFIRVPPSDDPMSNDTPKFGTFDATDLNNYKIALDLVVSHIASQTRTPQHYLSSSADRLSGESIKSAETGLVAKAKDKHVFLADPFEEAMRLAFKAIGDPRANEMSAEVIWGDPETRTEAEHIDAVGKKRQMLDVPREQCWEDAGYTPQQIARFKAMELEDQLFAPSPVEPVQPAPVA